MVQIYISYLACLLILEKVFDSGLPYSPPTKNWVIHFVSSKKFDLRNNTILVAKVNDDIEEAKPANEFEQFKPWDGSDMLSKGTCQKRSQDVRRWRRRRRRRRPASWWGSLRRRIPITWRRYGEQTSKGYEQLLLVDHHMMINRHLIESHG